MLRMDRIHVIRHKVLVEGQSARSVARQLGISRNTVRKYLTQSDPVRKTSEPRVRPILDKVSSGIEEILEDWKGRTSGKQRVTGTRVHEELIARGHRAGISTVRSYLAERRRAAAEVFVPLHYVAGDCAQVDFFEVVVDVGGERRKAWKLLVRLMYSGRDFAWLYERCDQVAFLDGHVRAFAHFGGHPGRMIYDNLKAAVKRRMGLDIQLSGRFQALVSHYLFEPCFARPGEGHDKGGVESRGKGIRLQHLTPIPQGESLGEISRRLVADLDRQMESKRNEDGETVAARWAEESRRLRPLPGTDFESRRVEALKVSRQAMVLVAGTRYSVPSHWKSLRVSAYVGTEDVKLVCGTETVVLPLEYGKKRVVRYRHYLEELAKKPQAVRQVSPRLLEELGEPFGRLWAMLTQRYSEREAARLLSRLLGVMVDHGEATIAEVIHEALERGDLDRLVLPQQLSPAALRPSVAVPEALQGVEVETTSAADFDEILEEVHHG